MEETLTSVAQGKEAATTRREAEMEEERISIALMTVIMATATIGINITETETIGIITTMLSGTTISGIIRYLQVRRGQNKTHQTSSR